MIRFATLPRIPVLAAVVFGALTLPALAQGTDEQREACTPDAVRLCQDTIPDIPKTTACMREHMSELSPHCRDVFEAGTDAAPRPHKPHVARDAPGPDDDTPDEAPRRARGPDPTDDEFDRARAVIGHMCDDEMIDPRTCAITERALSVAR